MLRLSAADLPSLLRRWLQEILYWQEVDGLAPSTFDFAWVEAAGRGRASVEATVAVGRVESRPVREIKGVTYHGLVVERRGGGWFARSSSTYDAFERRVRRRAGRRLPLAGSLQGAMRVEGLIFATADMMGEIRGSGAVAQVANVASLPGIVGKSVGMPDIHWGYGFAIGGVAAFSPEEGGVISPGGVGYDITAASGCTARSSPRRRCGPGSGR